LENDMKPMQVAKAALKTIWTHKALWVFGFFVAAAGAGGAGRASGGGKSLNGLPSQGLPSWLWIAIAAAGVIGVVGLVIHAICDAALIDGVRRSRAAEPVTVSQGFRSGVANFGRLVRVKLIGLSAMLACVLVVAMPAALRLMGILPTWAMAVLMIPLVLLAVPVLLSIFFLNVYALRIAVLETKGARVSYGEARRYLSGRILDSLKLLIVNFLGQAGGTAIAAMALLPGVLAGGLVYLAAGLIPALVVGGLVALPLLVTVMGAMGAFQSAVWTVGYLEGRAEEAA
jgi:hypothetical protein